MGLDIKNSSTIFDPLRKREVALTPEEIVRQKFIEFLNKKRNWPLSLMMSEKEISIGSGSNLVKFRCDIVAYNKELKPQLIVECKAPEVKITEKTFEQIWRYAIILKVKWLIITNGRQTFVCEYITDEQGEGKYVFKSDIPYRDK